jgi:hypothetical protein
MVPRWLRRSRDCRDEARDERRHFWIYTRPGVSSGIAALIAHVVFWLLLAYGWFWEDLGPIGVVVLLALWAVGFLGLRYLSYDAMFSSYVAALDVALVFLVFKGDIKLS